MSDAFGPHPPLFRDRPAVGPDGALTPYAAFAVAAGARRELWGWSALAILSLALAGVAALLLAASRTPGIQDVVPWPPDFFQRGLVAHVVFSFVVWFMAVFGGLLCLATVAMSGGRPRLGGLGGGAVAATAAASVLLFAPTLGDKGEPSLNNYVPVIIDPVYYGGLLLLAGAIGLMAIRLFANLRGRRTPLDPASLATAGAGAIYGIALVCFALAYARLAGQAPSPAFNEDLFWGGGHALQFASTALLLAAWQLLAGIAGGGSPVDRRLFAGAVVVLVLGALPMPFFYVAFDPFSAAQAAAFTDLQYALAPPTLAVAIAAAAGFARQRRAGRALPWRDPAFLCLALSVLVFAFGGVLGLFVDGADTRTPAHYHGVIGGINLAFMGLFYAVFLPLLGRPLKRGRVLYAQILLFAAGQVMASIGLFLAGSFGAARKIAGAGQGLEGLGALVGMTLNGLGALVAVGGGLLFIWTVARALLRAPAADR